MTTHKRVKPTHWFLLVIFIALVACFCLAIWSEVKASDDNTCALTAPLVQSIYDKDSDTSHLSILSANGVEDLGYLNGYATGLAASEWGDIAVSATVPYTNGLKEAIYVRTQKLKIFMQIAGSASSMSDGPLTFGWLARKIVYMKPSDHHTLYTYDVAGQANAIFYHDKSHEIDSFVASPDETKLGFTARIDDNNPLEAYVLDIAAREVKQITTDGGNGWIVWNSDSSSVAIEHLDNSMAAGGKARTNRLKTRVVNITTGEVTPIEAGDTDIYPMSWKAGILLLGANSDSGRFILTFDGKYLRTWRKSAQDNLEMPRFSPDGSQLLYLADHPDMTNWRFVVGTLTVPQQCEIIADEISWMPS